MRTREMGFEDYGLTEERTEALLLYCRNRNSLIEQAAQKANPAIARSLVRSLVEGTSYDRLTLEVHMPYHKNDFYAYRRRTLAILDGLLKAENTLVGDASGGTKTVLKTDAHEKTNGKICKKAPKIN